MGSCWAWIARRDRKGTVMKRVFVSYTHEDRLSATKLANGLKSLGHKAWIDHEELRVGQRWWDQILEQIKLADVVVLAISSTFLRSEACEVEWRYAAALNKPVLLVVVKQVDIDLLPVELAQIQFVDAVADPQGSAFELEAAVRDLEGVSLSDPLPDPPPPPLGSHAIKVVVYGHQSVDLSAQVSVAFKLIEYARSSDPSKRKRAHELIIDFLRRQDLFELPRTMLRSGVESSRVRSLAIVGAAIGGLAITHVFWATNFYAFVNGLVGEPNGVISFNLAVAVLGAILCLTAIQRKFRGALLGLVFCSVGILGAVVDAFKVGFL